MGVEAFQPFKRLVCTAEIIDIMPESACLLSLLGLGRMERGSVSMDSKFMLHSQRCFGLKSHRVDRSQRMRGSDSSTAGEGDVLEVFFLNVML